ncbi:hypothetical protein BK120_25160 [Paenibacillus sp. FSL A5-0031]|uniref:glycosyltransferase family 2 protein n=1 Tax=Paenibacillus sp. FSL A5-0031 TaxID=1920420 RepID=UPI00096E9AAC|nr:glycosyltransferase [Paenibacillus sp. FSL A5-0031]OME77988.1 hypothetical protein BK120_25160 [Paenibacillus sp. FSL A5-0031]
MRRKKRPVRRLKNNVSLRSTAEKRVERYRLGMNEGYEEGLKAGIESYDSYFEGTSIIIPSHNEVESVKACIEGIMDHTDLPYEIIVIDNGSSDGIEHYLRQLDGQVRYRILAKSAGFTGAANKGLMMAKGTTILLLNNGMRPTENWLDNLLICLNSDAGIGMVGPVSIGLTGKQKMEFHYVDLEDMHELARLNNASDSSKWHQTERLASRCLLFRRELLEKVGFLDEGCQESPFEAEDYGLRVRLQGYSLVYARDAYIHAERNDEELAEYNARESEAFESKHYFMNKWSGLDEKFLDREGTDFERQAKLPEWEAGIRPKLGESVFYPQQMVVKGFGETIYWIEDSVRRPIHGLWEQPVKRVSQLDLCRWPIGEPIEVDVVISRKGSLCCGDSNELQNGSIYISENGSSFYLENGKKRIIMSRLAADGWGLQTGHKEKLSEAELRMIPDGLPLIAPITLRQAL